MPSVLTLAGAPGQPLDAALMDALTAALPVRRRRERIALGAADFFLDTDDLAAVRAVTARAVGDRALDFCARADTPPGHWKLLIADMDSTIITVESIDELADFAGKRAEVAAITERAMRGEIDYEGALIERVALIQGLDEGALAECFRTRIALSPGARAMVRGCRDAGMYCALISGGFSFFSAQVAPLCGFHEHKANRLVIRDGRLTGEVALPALGRAAKVEALEDLCRRLGVGPERAICIGDGANDIGMLERAGLGVAWRPKPLTRTAADCAIDHGGLDVLLRFVAGE